MVRVAWWVLVWLQVGAMAPSDVWSADPACGERVATVVSVEGRVERQRAGEDAWAAGRPDDPVCRNDRVRTLERSRASLRSLTGTVIRLDHKTQVEFPVADPSGPAVIAVRAGRAFFLNAVPQLLTVETPYGRAGEGTDFVVDVDEREGAMTVTALLGRTSVANASGATPIERGQAAVSRSGQPPVLNIPVRPHDAAHWAAHYPSVLSFRDLGLSETEVFVESDWRSMVRRSYEFYKQGDLARAFSALDDASDAGPVSRVLTYRASLLLSVGRVRDAQSDIEKALSLDARDDHASALRAIIAAAQNDKDQAVRLALDAVRVNPESVVGTLALAHAYQASSRLDEALNAANDAVALDPSSALAWSQRAELLMGRGEAAQALEAARKALALNPRDARAQALVGFAHLMQMRVAEARAAFDAAVALDSASPLPRLGLGLVKIRRGELAAGREDLEIAVSLDPANALLRSYLGKAYYEEHRDRQAAIEFDLAKELDPNDPTPYLYDAIRKQTANRPVEALQDIERSIALNDNRAVYRSRLLLDADLAARSVSVGRVSEDLGFHQLALVEGWKSAQVDPGNYSAHRYLADSYAALPRSTTARLSELMVSQLLQPLSMNPVQPQLGVGVSAMPADTQPVDPSFNDYHELFLREGARVVGSGLWGGHGTQGGEVIVSGLSGRVSYSLGQSRQTTDGYRANADRTEIVTNAFAQAALTPSLSAQVEARTSRFDVGDPDLRFDSMDFSPSRRVTTDLDDYRVGLHARLSANEDWLTSVSYRRKDKRVDDSDYLVLALPFDIALSTREEPKGYLGETQYLLRSARWNLTTGAGRFRVGSQTTLRIPVFSIDLAEFREVHQTNGYLYVNGKVGSAGTLTAGLSRERFDGAPRDRDQWNPKLGFTLTPTPLTTIRLARFRTLMRSLVAARTLEPTHVAGFQQFYEVYEDLSGGVDFRRSGGVAIDHKLGSRAFTGIEWSMRDVVVPVMSLVVPGGILDVKREERLLRSYAYAAPRPWLSTTAEYQLERLDSSDFTEPFAPQITTHRVMIGPNLYHRSGLFAKLRGIYADQRGMFLTRATSAFAEGHDRFWLADVLVGYRMPRRLGVVTVEAKNVFDHAFHYQDTDPEHPLIQPGRVIFAKATMTF